MFNRSRKELSVSAESIPSDIFTYTKKTTIRPAEAAPTPATPAKSGSDDDPKKALQEQLPSLPPGFYWRVSQSTIFMGRVKIQLFMDGDLNECDSGLADPNVKDIVKSAKDVEKKYFETRLQAARFFGEYRTDEQ